MGSVKSRTSLSRDRRKRFNGAFSNRLLRPGLSRKNPARSETAVNDLNYMSLLRWIVLGTIALTSLHAGLITTRPSGGVTTVFDGGTTCNGGVTAEIDAGFTITSTGPACFPYSNGWGLGSSSGNGTWDPGFSLIGTNGSDIVIISLGKLASSVGGFMNYAIFNRIPVPIFRSTPSSPRWMHRAMFSNRILCLRMRRSIRRAARTRAHFAVLRAARRISPISKLATTGL